MSAPAPTDLLTCRECGALAAAGAGPCWLCGSLLPPVPSEQAPPLPRDVPTGGATFSLSSLMLIITLISVCLGVVTAAPGLIVPLVLIVTPALLRTFAVASRRKELGGELSSGEKITHFMTSVGLVFLIAIAAQVAFFLACAATCAVAFAGGNINETVLLIIIIVGTAVAVGLSLGIYVWLLRRTWPKKNKRSDEGP